MLKTKFLPLAIILSGAFASFHAQAAMTTDAHGNTGYDTAEECDAAVQSGSAKFYESFTTKPQLRRQGEVSVKQTTLGGLGNQYAMGACDVGAGKSFNRDGVSSALQGKYVPYSPSMPVNVYFNKAGQPVRATMKQCDNNFSGPSPRPVSAPVAQVAAAVEPEVVAEKTGLSPYVFGTVGALRDGVNVDAMRGGVHRHSDVSDSTTEFAGQVGAGLQFNEWLGTELFYQTGSKHGFNLDDASVNVRNQTFGARATLGGNLSEKFRMFGKVGVANVRHKAENYSENKTLPTAGLGMTYGLTDNLALRADYDHTFKSKSNSVEWKGTNYLGLGLQYNF